MAPMFRTQQQQQRRRPWASPLGVLLVFGVLAWLLFQYRWQQATGTGNDPYHFANTDEDDQEMQHAMDLIDDLNAHTPPPPMLDRKFCHAVDNADYPGSVVKWGADHLQNTLGECCAACSQHPDCNVFVWCGNPAGCGGERKHRECWLKKDTLKTILAFVDKGNPTIPWTSGALYDDAGAKEDARIEQERIDKLKNDPALPLVYFDIAIKGQAVGRIKMVLFTKEAPRAAENFRALCTGEKGTVPEGREGAGSQYHYKGKPFYRIVDDFIDQAGANTDSIYGGAFKDDPGGLALKHDRRGLLSMANSGADTNTSHFSILMSPAPHLDGHYTIFGEVVEGFEVAEMINALAHGQPKNQATAEAGAVIADSGQLR